MLMKIKNHIKFRGLVVGIHAIYFPLAFFLCFIKAKLEIHELTRLEMENGGKIVAVREGKNSAWSSRTPDVVCFADAWTAALFKQNRGGRAKLANTRKFDCLERGSHEFSHLLSESEYKHSQVEGNFANKSLRYTHACANLNIWKTRTRNLIKNFVTITIKNYD